jgi:hypothetical protein
LKKVEKVLDKEFYLGYSVTMMNERDINRATTKEDGMRKRLTKIETLRELQGYGQEVAWIANVITCHQPNAAKRLRGLLNLCRNGLTVTERKGVLMVNGGAPMSWKALEDVATNPSK